MENEKNLGMVYKEKRKKPGCGTQKEKNIEFHSTPKKNLAVAQKKITVGVVQKIWVWYMKIFFLNSNLAPQKKNKKSCSIGDCCDQFGANWCHFLHH